jgi:hypothetical protein
MARVELHTNNGYPLMYSAEARAKWFMYPDRGGSYYWPTLYLDGKDVGSSYSGWENSIYSQMAVPSDVRLTHVGTTYDTVSRSGQVQVECYNSGADAISAALVLAITEDSISFTGSNGDPWHNGVLRDFVPDQNGTAVSLAAGGSDTVTVPYSLDPSWVQEKVKLVVYLQNMILQGDTLACYQGLVGDVKGFVPGVEESKPVVARGLRVQVSPNPCRTGCEFTLAGAAAHGARIAMYAPDGRLVSTVQTSVSRASWSRAGLSRGVYLYRVNSGAATAEGKLVVTD